MSAKRLKDLLLISLTDNGQSNELEPFASFGHPNWVHQYRRQPQKSRQLELTLMEIKAELVVNDVILTVPKSYRPLDVQELHFLRYLNPQLKDRYGALVAAGTVEEIASRGRIVPYWGGYPSYDDIWSLSLDEPRPKFITPGTSGRSCYLVLTKYREKIYP